MTEPYTRFIITGDARTGSTMLAQSLNTNPAICCFREIFHPTMEYINYAVDGFDPNNPEDIAQRKADPVRFLETRIFSNHATSVHALGFKYLYASYWGHDVLTEHFRADSNLLVVHLKRRNMLRSLVSVQLAEATNKWIEDWGPAQRRPFHVRAASAAVHPVRTVQRLRKKFAQPAPQPKPALTITKEDCERWFFRTNHEVTRVDGLFSSHSMIELYYEDMLADRDGAFARVQEFVGVEPQQLLVSLRRQNPEPLRELIANYDELRSAFAGTAEEAFFDD